MRSRRLTLIKVAVPLLASSLASLSTLPAASAAVPVSKVYFTGPAGSGTKCTVASPCSLPTALSRANGGDQVVVGPGAYPRLTTAANTRLAAADTPARVVAVPGSTPTIAALTTNTANVVWTGLTFTGQVIVNGSAQRTVLDRVSVTGAGIFLRARDSIVRGSEISNGRNIDGIQVGRADNAQVIDNSIHDMGQDPGNSSHADCIQVFDSSGVTIRGNRLRDCYNAGLIASVGSGLGIDRLTVESNFIQTCLVVTPTCKGGSAADLREATATNMVFRNNTVAAGSLRIVPLPGLIADRNIVAWLSDCSAPLTNSIIAEWNVKMCRVHPALADPAAGNRVGVPRFVNAAVGDLRPLELSDVQITRPAGAWTPVRDLLGLLLPADVAGAALPSTDALVARHR